MKRISLIHPSRSRPIKSEVNVNDWFKKSGLPPEQIEIIVSLDVDDNKVHEYDQEQYPVDTLIIVNRNRSVVDATNKAADISTGDILIYLSDDFQCPDNWGQLVLKEFETDKPRLIKVDDCLQPLGTAVLTIPMMNRQLYHKLGYFWYHEYRSMFVDEDLYWTARKLEALHFAEHLKFPHIHPANGTGQDDDVYKRSAANWDQGKEVFRIRRGQGFPV